MDTPIRIERLSHSFGEGAVRKQILFDITAEIHAGEIVIVTGPSGSGKTTLLTILGALRSAQEGRVMVLGEELNGAPPRVLNQVRRSIGYIFQAHNLLDSLTALQNVSMSLHLHPELSTREVKQRSLEMLNAVGLGDCVDQAPHRLSVGQKQRIAIARALASRPKIVLADEPTAALDKQTGRDVVDLMHDLAKNRGVTVLLVTHDNRILDVADRIVHLEDGRLTSFAAGVAASTQRMMDMLALNNRKGAIRRRIQGLSIEQFGDFLAQATRECDDFMRAIEMSNSEAFESMLEQILEAFTLKIGEILRADRVSLFLVDEDHQELFSKVAQSGTASSLELRAPLSTSIAGHVATTGKSMNTLDAHAEPLFHAAIDRETGYDTRTILCVPLTDKLGRVFAVVELLNKEGGAPFGDADEKLLRAFTSQLGVVLEGWSRLRRPAKPGNLSGGPDTASSG